MHTDNAKIVCRLLENGTIVPEKWGEYTEKHLSENDRQLLSDTAAALSVEYARISEYMGQRGGYGTFDHGHEEAMKAAQNRAKKVREALNYTIP